jgi:hypothetical protein
MEGNKAKDKSESVEDILRSSIVELAEQNGEAHDLLLKKASEGFFEQHQTSGTLRKPAPDLRETIGRASHDHYRHIHRGNAHSQDPSMAQWGNKKDVTKKISPYLVGWAERANEVKEWDRELVRQIPGFLARVGLEIHRQRSKGKGNQ